MDIILILILIIVPLGSLIYIRVQNLKYKKKDIKKLMSGFEVARTIIDNNELSNIYITETRHSIISEYDNNRKVIRLKKDVFNDTSLTSCAIAAREAAHAIQDKKKHKLYCFRNRIKQLLDIFLYIGYIVIAVGALFGNMYTIYVGMSFEYVVLLFHILTLKIEKDASKIAINQLLDEKIINKREIRRINELLRINNYRYIASIIYPIIEVIKKIIEFGDSNE